MKLNERITPALLFYLLVNFHSDFDYSAYIALYYAPNDKFKAVS